MTEPIVIYVKGSFQGGPKTTMIGKHTPRGQGGNKVDSSLSTPRSPIDLKEPTSHLVSPSKPWPDANKAKMRSLQFQNNHMSLWGKSGWVYFLFSIYLCLDMLHFSVFPPKKFPWHHMKYTKKHSTILCRGTFSFHYLLIVMAFSNTDEYKFFCI